MAKIESLGHVGIYAEDLMKMRDFYSRVLGLEISDEDLEERGMTFFTADKDNGVTIGIIFYKTHKR